MHYSPEPMHIPDGFLSMPVAIILWLIAIVVIAIAIRQVSRNLKERQIPLMGIMAAFIFAAQMINFPVIGGTSGHLLGGVLAGVVLGPWAGILVMSAVVIVQGLLFQDGGLLVMGANIVNMGMITVVIGYGLYRIVAGRSIGVRLLVSGVAAWISVMAAALFTSLELWLSSTIPLAVVIPAMLGVHALIGIGEALITVAALAFILRVRPDILDDQAEMSRGGRGWAIGGIVIAIAVVLLAPLASADPDGLERVAIDMNFIQRGQEAPFQVLSGYTLPFLGESAMSTILAGLIGVLVLATAAVLLVYLVRQRKTS
jgi:cobalt/nickel transport system permease protein